MISEQEQLTDTSLLWRFLKKKFKLILIAGFLGSVLALSFSFFIRKEYKSMGVVFPPSGPSVEASVDNPNFGYDVEADRLIQIFYSNEVRDSVVKKFDLMNYYELDANAKESLDKLIKEYSKNVHFERTPSMSIVLSAQTYSPELSANIINYIIETTDKVREKIYKQNLKTSYDNALSDYNHQKSKVDSAQLLLNKTLKENNLSNLVLLASNAQISVDLAKLTSHENSNSNLTIGSDIIAFKNMLDRMHESEGKLIRLKKILSTPTPKLFVIDHAEPRYKKVWPLYSTNVIAGFVIGSVIMIMVLLILSVRETGKF